METTEINERVRLLPPSPDVNPKDRLKLVYIILYLLGAGSLLPWNFFSNAEQYFRFKLRNTSLPDEQWSNSSSTTDLQNMFESYLSIAAMLPNVCFLFLNTAATKFISLNIRMVTASCVMICMFVMTISLVYVNTDEWQTGFFAVTLATIVVMNAGSAILQGGLFGLASLFPPNYIQGAMGGMGMGGTIAAVANVLAVTIATNPLSMGFGYFITAMIVLLFALAGYLLLPHLKFARYHRADRSTTHSISISDSDAAMKSDSSSDEGDGITIEIVDPQPAAIAPGEYLSLYQVFRRIRTYALLVFFTFSVTLSCYPAVNSTIKSMDTSGPWAEKYFVPVVCFLLFNVSDLIGRTIPGLFIWPREDSPMLVILCVSRVVFIPLFLLCNKSSTYYIPTIFTSDVIPIVLMILFGLTNGYFGTLCMMYGPRRVPAQDTETAGSMMSFFLALGLGFGSLISFPFVKLQTTPSP